MLTSPDGSNFEEALCWKPTGKDAESFTETLLFSRSPCMRIGFRRVKFVSSFSTLSSETIVCAFACRVCGNYD